MQVKWSKRARAASELCLGDAAAGVLHAAASMRHSGATTSVYRRATTTSQEPEANDMGSCLNSELDASKTCLPHQFEE